MEKEEMEIAIKRLQAMNAAHEALLLAIFDQSKDKAAIRQAVVNESKGLGDEMLAAVTMHGDSGAERRVISHDG